MPPVILHAASGKIFHEYQFNLLKDEKKIERVYVVWTRMPGNSR